MLTMAAERNLTKLQLRGADTAWISPYCPDTVYYAHGSGPIHADVYGSRAEAARNLADRLAAGAIDPTRPRPDEGTWYVYRMDRRRLVIRRRHRTTGGWGIALRADNMREFRALVDRIRIHPSKLEA